MTEHLEELALPSPEELQKYKDVDGAFLDHVRETAVEERKFRHEITHEGVTIGKREQILVHGLSYFALIAALLVFVVGMAFSYFLLKEGHDIGGSIFAGGTMVYMGWLFMSKNKGSAPGQ